MTPVIEAFFKKHKDELDDTPYSTFKKECPRIKVSSVTYYVWRKKAMSLSSNYAQPIRKALRQRLYKQFFTVLKDNTTDEAIALLRSFIEKINSSNHNSRFELVEYVIKNDEDIAIVEVREYK